MPASTPTTLTIATLGISAPVIKLGLNPDHTVQVPKRVDVTGWYRYGPTPGEAGPAVILGHVDSAAAGRGVFYHLRDLNRGDSITVTRADRSIVTFAVTAMRTVPKDAFPTSDVYGPTPDPELRLVTCGGPFDAATGHYRDNVIVYARLAS